MPVFALERQLLPQEVPWTGKQPLSNKPVIEGKSMRAWHEATVFPEFVYVGTLDGALEYLTVKSRNFSPGGTMGLVVRGIEMDRMRVNVSLRGRNALQLVDALCALGRCNWTLGPYGIIIHREPKIPHRELKTP
uniref:hypothetical protein n=1 Tax=Prosthecobacter sp. TaxID=1965333 RepID=UPI003784FE8F